MTPKPTVAKFATVRCSSQITRKQTAEIAKRCNLDFEFALRYFREVEKLRRKYPWPDVQRWESQQIRDTTKPLKESK